jgi:hypothetical protein
MDSWTLGGIDPASGTSVLVEMARTFGNIKEKSGNHESFHMALASFRISETNV